MTIDHLGAILYPEHVILRVVGRISFPLFCYLLVLGYKTTQNMGSYFLRLLLFAFISQVPYYLAFGFAPLEQLNIFFTLSFGLLSLLNPILGFLSLLISFFLNFDFGPFGILMIFCMRVLDEDTKWGVVSLSLLGVYSLFTIDLIQTFFLFVLPIILLYKKNISKIKIVNGITFNPPPWGIFFYFYYPLHLIALHLLK